MVAFADSDSRPSNCAWLSSTAGLEPGDERFEARRRLAAPTLLAPLVPLAALPPRPPLAALAALAALPPLPALPEESARLAAEEASWNFPAWGGTARRMDSSSAAELVTSSGGTYAKSGRRHQSTSPRYIWRLRSRGVPRAAL